MRARLVDVAAKAGVAPNTASTILNNRPNSWASQETRERVLNAAKELGYRPSKAALAVRLGRFNSIGVVIPDLHNPFYSALADLIGKAVSVHGYDVIIEHSGMNLERERHSFQTILDRQVDGVILIVSDTEYHRPFLTELAAKNFPAVGLAAKPALPLPIDSVVIDFSDGLTQAVDHLLELRHRRFVFLCALEEGQDDGNRPAIFRSLLQEKSIPAADVHFIRCHHDIASAREAFHAFLSRVKTRRPTALIALNDLSAIGAMRAAVEDKLQIPRDLSVIGVDNIPIGEHLPVALSTIAQPIEDMANRTVSLLLKRIESQRPAKPSQTIFPTDLILRESSGPAPAPSV